MLANLKWILLIVSISLTACIFGDDPQKTEDTIVDLGTWPLENRKHYLTEWIIVEFKSGNKRGGHLMPSTSPNQIEIGKSKDAGVYNLDEIERITHDREVIFP